MANFLEKKHVCRVNEILMAPINVSHKKYLQICADNALIKQNKRIEHIKKVLHNDLQKKAHLKYYQIKSFYEWKILRKYINSITTEYDLKWCNQTHKQNEPQQMNNLDKIISGLTYCCKDCDKPMKYINKKVNCIYCYLSKI